MIVDVKFNVLTATKPIFLDNTSFAYKNIVLFGFDDFVRKLWSGGTVDHPKNCGDYQCRPYVNRLTTDHTSEIFSIK